MSRLFPNLEALEWSLERLRGEVGPQARMDPADLPVEESLVMVGAGGAECLLQALEAGKIVHLWDRHPPNFRGLLEQADWRSWITSRKLWLYAGLELFSVPRSLPVAGHPATLQRYARELSWYLEERRQRRALLVEGGLMVEELSLALQDQGYGLWTWDIHRIPPAELEALALAFAPELVVAVNHHPGLPEAVEKLGEKIPELRLRVWEIDPATDRLRTPLCPCPRTWIHTWRKAQVPAFHQAGYLASWLPLATDPERRRPLLLNAEEELQYAAPVTYVGRSTLVEAAHHRRQLLSDLQRLKPSAEAVAELEKVLAAQRAGPEQYTIPERMTQAFPGLDQMNLPHDPIQLAGELAAAEMRLTTVANLGSFGIHVWGDEGWRNLERYGVRFRGPAGHRLQLPRIYSNGGIHVDIGRIYQLDIVTLRVFEVLACGGFLIAHYSPDLEELFEIGVELESWRTLPELKSKIAYYIEKKEERQRIGERGRQRVIRDHRVAQRLAVMLESAPPLC